MIRVPPLQARREDIPQLFLHLVRESAVRHRVDERKALPELLARLSAQDWPGHVRELRNAAAEFGENPFFPHAQLAEINCRRGKGDAAMFGLFRRRDLMRGV